MTDAGPACPHCASTDVEPVGAWGGQLITCQLRCRRCHTYFEAVRDVFSQGAERPGSLADD